MAFSVGEELPPLSVTRLSTNLLSLLYLKSLNRSDVFFKKISGFPGDHLVFLAFGYSLLSWNTPDTTLTSEAI